MNVSETENRSSKPDQKAGTGINVENSGIQFLYGFILTLVVIIMGMSYQFFSTQQTMMVTLLLVSFLVLKESIPNVVMGLSELLKGKKV